MAQKWLAYFQCCQSYKDDCVTMAIRYTTADYTLFPKVGLRTLVEAQEASKMKDLQENIGTT